jgi:hypothetical protein
VPRIGEFSDSRGVTVPAVTYWEKRFFCCQRLIWVTKFHLLTVSRRTALRVAIQDLESAMLTLVQGLVVVEVDAVKTLDSVRTAQYIDHLKSIDLHHWQVARGVHRPADGV